MHKFKVALASGFVSEGQTQAIIQHPIGRSGFGQRRLEGPGSLGGGEEGEALFPPVPGGLDVSRRWGIYLALAQGCFSPQVTQLDPLMTALGHCCLPRVQIVLEGFSPLLDPQTLLFTFCLPSPDRVPEAYPVPIRWETGNRGWFSESEWPSGKHLTMTLGAREQVTQKSHAIQKLKNASVGGERETETRGRQSIAGLMIEQEMGFERQAIFMRPWGDWEMLRPEEGVSHLCFAPTVLPVGGPGTGTKALERQLRRPLR